MINLDFLCMKTAQDMMQGTGMASDKLIIATKGLGVLIEQGPYALVLFLKAEKSSVSDDYIDKLVSLCGENLVSSYISGEVPQNTANFNEVVVWLTVSSKDLDGYLFIKRLWQQTLTYARYHAKVLKAGQGG